jgi:hypothetical protein
MTYALGQHAALDALSIKEASMRTVLVRSRKDPFAEIYRRLAQTFKVKTPKFDLSAHLKRLMNNPFKQPTTTLGGKLQPLKM